MGLSNINASVHAVHEAAHHVVIGRTVATITATTIAISIGFIVLLLAGVLT